MRSPRWWTPTAAPASRADRAQPRPPSRPGPTGQGSGVSGKTPCTARVRLCERRVEDAACERAEHRHSGVDADRALESEWLVFGATFETLGARTRFSAHQSSRCSVLRRSCFLVAHGKSGRLSRDGPGSSGKDEEGDGALRLQPAPFRDRGGGDVGVVTMGKCSRIACAPHTRAVGAIGTVVDPSLPGASAAASPAAT